VTEILPRPSTVLTVGFVVLPVAVALIVVAGVVRTSGSRVGSIGAVIFAAWFMTTGTLAVTGFFDAWAPPRLMLVLIVVLAVLIWAFRSRWAARLAELPLYLLVGFQSFRILVELLIHQAVVEDIAPPNLTWTGNNFDMIPAISALVVAHFANHMFPSWLQIWNIGGALILAVTVGTAVLTMPTPFQQFHTIPPNVWIATFPFIWLPAVLVLCAWLGHVVLFRRLLRASRG
jgi:hypothetical protein